MAKYYALYVDNGIAHVYIFGDIVSWEWFENDRSSYTLARELRDVDAGEIHVHINSYGGEVAEGLAIYNTLKAHKAKIVTICEGFACSAASYVFMAGDERRMSASSMLMIHNAWTRAQGDANDLRKEADDIEKINDVAVNVYRNANLAIDGDELTAMLDAGTWITPINALTWGFATIIDADTTSTKAAANVRRDIAAVLLADQNARLSATKPKPEPEPAPEPEPDPMPNMYANFRKFFKAQ